MLRHPSLRGTPEKVEPRSVGRERAHSIGTAPGSRRLSGKTTGPSAKELGITHPERIVYPGAGITKLDVAQYYHAMADLVLRYSKNRPLALVRCPSGLPGACFFQKHATDAIGNGLVGVPIEEANGTATYLAATDRQGLVALAQMGVLELHIWDSRADALERPDMFVMDLDPDEALPFSDVVEGARLMRALLQELGLASFVKTTGGKGLHVVVPLQRRSSWDDVKRFTQGLADHMARTMPDRFTAKMAKTRRKGKIFIDYLRNARGATAVAPYSLRARAGAPIATPLQWDELTRGLDPAEFNLKTASRLRTRTDPWPRYFDLAQSITRNMRRRLGVD
jgi:bifunctional non-homologous end joining protein LigD